MRMAAMLLIIATACSAGKDPVIPEDAVWYNPAVGDSCERFVAVEEAVHEGESAVPEGLLLPGNLELVGAVEDRKESTTLFRVLGDFEEAESFLKTDLSKSSWSDGGWGGGEDPLGRFVSVNLTGWGRGDVTLVECQGDAAILVSVEKRN